MKKIIIICALLIAAINLNAENYDHIIEKQKARIDSIELNIHSLSDKVDNLSRSIHRLESADKSIADNLDSISNHIDALENDVAIIKNIQFNDRISFQDSLNETNVNIATNMRKMDTRTFIGGVLLLVCVIVLVIYLYVKRRRDFTSMSEVRKAQEALQNAQTKMQEDSIRLDNQLLSLLEKQISASQTTSALTGKDHSLALKVADEIVRIQLNLSRMDPSIKGYKPLSKAVERIKDNFMANGYEIVDMLGKPYNEGMKVVANFIPDESLKEGEQIITGIIKPQINFNGKMIQSAQITVSQNI